MTTRMGTHRIFWSVQACLRVRFLASSSSREKQGPSAALGGIRGRRNIDRALTGQRSPVGEGTQRASLRGRRKKGAIQVDSPPPFGPACRRKAGSCSLDVFRTTLVSEKSCGNVEMNSYVQYLPYVQA